MDARRASGTSIDGSILRSILRAGSADTCYQVKTPTMRSRLPLACADDESATRCARKRRVLPIVLAAVVFPSQIEGLHATSGGVRQSETIRGRMPGVAQVHRLGGIGVDSHSPLGSHVNEIRGLNRPLRAAAIEANWCWLQAQKLSISPDSAAMGPPAAPLAIAVIASRCSALALSSAMSPTDQLPFAIASGVKPSTMNLKPSRDTVP